MVGRAALNGCLESPQVKRVLMVNRRPLAINHPKLQELVIRDFTRLEGQEEQLTGYNACIFCAGVSSMGLSREEYHKLTYDLTLSFARVLLSWNTDLSFVYISGKGTDSTEKKGPMWARVKGKTENALLALPFKNSYMFRPGYIQPKGAIRSKVLLYTWLYTLLSPFYPLFKKLFPNSVTSSDALARALLRGFTDGYEKHVLETEDINALAVKVKSHERRL